MINKTKTNKHICAMTAAMTDKMDSPSMPVVNATTKNVMAHKNMVSAFLDGAFWWEVRGSGMIQRI